MHHFGSVATGSVRVWVGCLGHYNDGELSGAWVDASEAATWVCPLADPDNVYVNCEETWVMDHEFPGVRGEMSPSEAVAWSEAFDRVPDRLRGAFVAWLKHADVGYPDRKLVDRFESAYRGEYDSLDDYAMTFLEECLPDFKAPDGYRIVPDDSWEQSHTYADGYVFSDDDN